MNHMRFLEDVIRLLRERYKNTPLRISEAYRAYARDEYIISLGLIGVNKQVDIIIDRRTVLASDYRHITTAVHEGAEKLLAEYNEEQNKDMIKGWFGV